MTPLTLFLLGCATIFLGSVQAAFSALMRLSLRLMAERGRGADRLSQYLDDPLQLFIPVRVLIGVCTVLAGLLIAAFVSIPIVNLAAPLFGTALMVHVHKRMTQGRQRTPDNTKAHGR